jgi:alkanesulfonate monooxygenase SsuD/methylene tetrahydromethanopterin reductase-like flavin-dependent oxidoreductase (luciferase family)
MPTIDLGVFLPTMTEPGRLPPDPAEAARHAEDLGFESAWVVDQLVAGTGAPFIESIVALSAAAGATSRIKLGLGVMILPLRPLAWAGKQVASLQHVSGDRLLLGVGVGGARHDRSWAAVGVPVHERGRRTDAALAVLPDLIAGREVVLPLPGSPTVQLAPGAAVPPIVVGGTSAAAIERAIVHGDDWFLLPGPPSSVRDAREQLHAAAHGRPVPRLTASVTVTLEGDAALPDHDEVVRLLTNPDGVYGMPVEAVPSVLVSGDPAAIAELLTEYAAAGAHRVIVTIAAGDWHRQTELLAEAYQLVR